MIDDMYNDQPRDIESWIDSLSDHDRAMFDKGYVTALLGLLEQLNESQRKILIRIMGLEEEDFIDEDEFDEAKRQLESKLILLDIYEKHYAYRVRNLTRRYNLTANE